MEVKLSFTNFVNPIMVIEAKDNFLQSSNCAVQVISTSESCVPPLVASLSSIDLESVRDDLEKTLMTEVRHFQIR